MKARWREQLVNFQVRSLGRPRFSYLIRKTTRLSMFFLNVEIDVYIVVLTLITSSFFEFSQKA